MTTEQKAKAYDEALEKAKKYHEDYWIVEAKDITETLFPELRESEDERIRKEIIEFVDTTTLSTDERHHRWIAYLEKQKEQKPAEWSEEDENALKYLHELISFGFTENFFDAQTAADMREWLNTRLKSLRPSWRPSEEQNELMKLKYAGTSTKLD